MRVRLNHFASQCKMDFDDFDDDLDSLLDLESNLAEAGNHIKRSLADLQSQRDAAACLAGAQDCYN